MTAVAGRHSYEASKSPQLKGFDLSKPEDYVKLFAKVVGSLDEQIAYLQYIKERKP